MRQQTGPGVSRCRPSLVLTNMTTRLTVALPFVLSVVACSGATETDSASSPPPELSARGASNVRSDLDFVESYTCNRTRMEGLVGGGQSDEEGRCMGYRVCDGGYDAMIECEDYQCTCSIDGEDIATFELTSNCPGPEGPDWLLELCPFDVWPD